MNWCPSAGRGSPYVGIFLCLIILAKGDLVTGSCQGLVWFVVTVEETVLQVTVQSIPDFEVFICFFSFFHDHLLSLPQYTEMKCTGSSF